jgi:hypothetical protein
MNKRPLLCVLALVLVTATACVASLPTGKSGAVAMIPFVDQEHGMRGNRPLEGWSDRAALIQQAVTGTQDELVAEIVKQTDLVRLPDPIGTFQGAHLNWNLYVFTSQLPDVGPGIYRIDMGVAKGEQENRYYMVILITRTIEYEGDQALNQTVFEHALYALAPLE